MNDTNSLAHTKWNCKYHIVFATLIWITHRQNGCNSSGFLCVIYVTGCPEEVIIPLVQRLDSGITRRRFPQ